MIGIENPCRLGYVVPVGGASAPGKIDNPFQVGAQYAGFGAHGLQAGEAFDFHQSLASHLIAELQGGDFAFQFL